MKGTRVMKSERGGIAVAEGGVEVWKDIFTHSLVFSQHLMFEGERKSGETMT